MSDHEISHLDLDTSPFDAIMSLDGTLGVTRRALSSQLRRLTIDALRDDQEALLVDALMSLYAARQALVDCCEEDG